MYPPCVWVGDLDWYSVDGQRFDHLVVQIAHIEHLGISKLSPVSIVCFQYPPPQRNLAEDIVAKVRTAPQMMESLKGIDAASTLQAWRPIVTDIADSP
jgi:hypothetical protein